MSGLIRGRCLAVHKHRKRTNLKQLHKRLRHINEFRFVFPPVSSGCLWVILGVLGGRRHVADGPKTTQDAPRKAPKASKPLQDVLQDLTCFRPKHGEFSTGPVIHVSGVHLLVNETGERARGNHFSTIVPPRGSGGREPPLQPNFLTNRRRWTCIDGQREEVSLGLSHKRQTNTDVSKQYPKMK